MTPTVAIVGMTDVRTERGYPSHSYPVVREKDDKLVCRHNLTQAIRVGDDMETWWDPTNRWTRIEVCNGWLL